MASSKEESAEYDPWFDQISLGIAPADDAVGGSTGNTKVVIKNPDGSTVDVDSLNVSDKMKDLLKAVDSDGGGTLDDTNVQHALQLFGTMKEVFGSKGTMSHKEAENGLHLLQQLFKDKAANAHEVSYMHMPECVQEVMKEWDLDRSGSVSVVELSAAAKAHRKVKEEGRIMRRIIVALSAVIVLLLTGMFVMSYLAVDMAKEMRGDTSGVMTTGNGEVVKTASSAFDVQADGTVVTRDSVTPSCPANSTCRRLQSAAPVLQVAQSKPAKQLTSVLPDDVFKRLDMVTLKADPHFLQLKVTSMKRVQVRSSKCGSVVELHTQEGVLTIDDVVLSADDQLAEYLNQAGMLHLLTDGGLFGRRLQEGFLEGFFEFLEDMEWECTSAPLPDPKDLPLNYRAKTVVMEQVWGVGVTEAEMQADLDKKVMSSLGPYMHLPGIVMHNGTNPTALKRWTEDALVFPGLRVAKKHFEMHPLQDQIDVVKGGSRAFLEQMGDTGHYCHLGPSGISLAMGKLVSQATNFRLVGLKQEGGRRLRQWRMDVADTMNDDISKALDELEVVPKNITLDYYDIDTDSTGKFQAGQPYRIHAFRASVYNVTVQYTEIIPLTDTLDVVGALDYMGVKQLSTACEVDPLQALASRPEDTALIQEIEQLGIVASPKVPRIEPWTEWPGALKFTSDKITQAIVAGTMEDHFKGYWKQVLHSPRIQNKLTMLSTEVISSGPAVIQFDQDTLGLDASIEVAYSALADLPGGISSMKVVIKGDALNEENGMGAKGLDLEASISAAAHKSCVTQQITGVKGVAGSWQKPATIVLCLMAEYDHIEFSMVIASGSVEANSNFAVATFHKNFAFTTPTSTSRSLCDDCTTFPQGEFHTWTN